MNNMMDISKEIENVENVIDKIKSSELYSRLTNLELEIKTIKNLIISDNRNSVVGDIMSKSEKDRVENVSNKFKSYIDDNIEVEDIGDVDGRKIMKDTLLDDKIISNKYSIFINNTNMDSEIIEKWVESNKSDIEGSVSLDNYLTLTYLDESINLYFSKSHINGDNINLIFKLDEVEVDKTSLFSKLFVRNSKWDWEVNSVNKSDLKLELINSDNDVNIEFDVIKFK